MSEEITKYVFKIKTECVGELQPYMKALDMACFLFELRHNFWRKWKHAELTDEQYSMKEEVLDALQELLDEHNLNTDLIE